MKSQKKISNKLIFHTFIVISHKTRDPNHPIKVKDTTKLSNKYYCYKNITYGIYQSTRCTHERVQINNKIFDKAFLGEIL